MSDSGCSRDAGAARNIAKQHRVPSDPSLRLVAFPTQPFCPPSAFSSPSSTKQPLSPFTYRSFTHLLTHSLFSPVPADPLCAFFLACALALPSATAFWLNPSFRAIPQRNRQRQLSNCHPSSIVLKRCCCTVVVDDLYPQFCDGSSGSAIIQTAPGSISVTRAGARRCSFAHLIDP